MSTVPHADLVARIHEAMSTVIDPEIRRPITELDMVKSVSIASDDDNGAHVVIAINLTTEGCPMKSAIEERVSVAAQGIDGVARVTVELGAMTPDQREALKVKLRGSATPVIPFTQPGNLTRIYAIASGKGGVGKSTVTANLAAAMAAQGLSVGVIDADIYGFSIPRLLGARSVPTKVGSMLLPPIAHEVKVVSIGMFVPAGQPVVWRGPMLHRALEQFLTDVYWGDLDVLLLDLPPAPEILLYRWRSCSPTQRSSPSPRLNWRPLRLRKGPVPSLCKLGNHLLGLLKTCRGMNNQTAPGCHCLGREVGNRSQHRSPR